MFLYAYTAVAERAVAQWTDLKSRSDRGATAVEYGLLAALIAAVIVAIVATLGTKIGTAFSTINSKLP
jgi:pilus assembly protein Flp/PilA